MLQADREKIIKYYSSSDEGEIAARLLDLASQVLQHKNYKISRFLDKREFSIAETILAHARNKIILKSNGGFEEAERVKAAFVNEGFAGNIDWDIKVAALKWDKRYYQLTHRDILGAIIGLGIDRDRIGDILVGGEDYQAAVIYESKIEKIINGLLKVGSATVEVSALNLSDLKPKEIRTKEIRATVASLRIDSIAAAGFGISRSRAAEELKADRYQLNWQAVKNTAQIVKAGDIISCRGRGRMEVSGITGQTKKGRIGVLLVRYI